MLLILLKNGECMLPIDEKFKKLLVNETTPIAIKSFQNLLYYPIDN